MLYRADVRNFSDSVGNIVIPEGRLGSGWRAFGLNLRKTFKPTSLSSHGSLHRIQSAPKADAAVVVGKPHNHGGAKNTGKDKITVFQNSNPSNPSNSVCDQGRSYSGEDMAQFGVDILSNINVTAKSDLLTLDITLRVERGKEGQWAVVSSIVKDVGSNQISHGMRPNTFKGYNMYTQNWAPKPKPKAQPQQSIISKPKAQFQQPNIYKPKTQPQQPIISKPKDTHSQQCTDKMPMKLISPSMHPSTTFTTNGTSYPPRCTTSTDTNMPPTSTIIKDTTSDIVISPPVKNNPTPPSTADINFSPPVKNSPTTNSSNSSPPWADSLQLGSMSAINLPPLTNDISQSSATTLSDLPIAPLKKNEAFTAEREREIQQVVESVNELAQIMKDLSVLVIDQGTIVDRIDHNIQTVATTVEEGLKQLQKHYSTGVKPKILDSRTD
nr:syntaxin-41 [Quercus suber]